jgi:hypothetical protein
MTGGSVSCFASAAFPDALGQLLTISGTSQQSTDEWLRVSTTFTIPENMSDPQGLVSADLSFNVTERMDRLRAA